MRYALTANEHLEGFCREQTALCEIMPVKTEFSFSVLTAQFINEQAGKFLNALKSEIKE